MQCEKLKTYMETGRVVFLPAKFIRPNPDQPRKNFSRESLEELAQSIETHGILQPLSVRRVGSGYVLIAGERRLRAAKLAGLTEIPCIVMRMDDRESALTALVENIQRQELDFWEEARAISQLLSSYTMSQEQVARLLGKSQSAVANKLRILKHSEPVLEAIRENALTERHARALLKLSTDSQKLQAIAMISRLHMGVSRAEQYIEGLLREQEDKRPRPRLNAFLSGLDRSLAQLRLSGMTAVSERKDTEDRIVLTITIPK